MANRIERDPTGDIAPDSSVIEAALPTTLTADEHTAAVQRARDAWQTHHDGLVAAWDAQRDADAAAARVLEEAAAAERQRLEDVRLEAIREAEEAERLALEAKHPKFNVDDNAEPPVSSDLQAANSTREDLRKGKWVAWHLLTPEMCKEDMNAYQHDPVLNMTTGDGSIVVLHSARRSTKTPVLPDDKLSFEQWSSAIPIYLHTIKDFGWAPSIVDQWNSLLFQLLHHNARFEDPRAIVLYSALLRADRHRDFQDGKVQFNVSRISEFRLNNALLASKMKTLDTAVAEAKVIYPLFVR